MCWPPSYATIVHDIYQFKQERPHLRLRYSKNPCSDEFDSWWLSTESWLYLLSQVYNTVTGIAGFWETLHLLFYSTKHKTLSGLKNIYLLILFLQIQCCGTALCIKTCGTGSFKKGIIRRIISWTCEIEMLLHMRTEETCEKLINKRKEGHCVSGT